MADDSVSQLKTCTKCGVPKTPEKFRKHRRSCRECELAWDKAYKKSLDPEVVKAKLKAYRKTLDPEIVRAKLRDYRRRNPDKAKFWDKQNSEKHRAPGSEYLKRKYARLDKAKAKRDAKKWRLDNPEKSRNFNHQHYIKNKQHYSDKAAQRYRENPEAFIARSAIRRARESGSEGNFTKDDIRELLKKNGRVCFYCGEALKKFHADHFIPLVKGGSNSIENIRLCCPGCNFSKHAKMPWEWKPDRFREQDFI